MKFTRFRIATLLWLTLTVCSFLIGRISMRDHLVDELQEMKLVIESHRKQSERVNESRNNWHRRALESLRENMRWRPELLDGELVESEFVQRDPLNPYRRDSVIRSPNPFEPPTPIQIDGDSTDPVPAGT